MKLFASIRLTIVLIALVVAALIFGSFLDQEIASHWIYRSFWFFGLVLVFLVNLGACTIQKLVPFKVRRIGFYITHLSILVLCSGFLLDLAFGISGTITLTPGKKQNEIIIDGKIKKALPFDIRLESFSIERYSDIIGAIKIYDRSRNEIGSYPVRPGSTIRDAALPFEIGVESFIPDFTADMKTGAVFSRSQNLENPAVRITVSTRGKDYSLWLFSMLPESPLSLKVPGYAFVFDCNKNNAIKSYKSEISIWEGTKKNKTAVIEVNNPFSYKGYDLLQSGFDPIRLAWSSLAISCSPGLSLVYCGFILLVLGIISLYLIRLFIKEKK